MSKLDKDSVIGITALLVHAANIDEIYSDHEKELIKNFIKSYLKEENTSEILKPKPKDESPNQCNFIENMSERWKIKREIHREIDMKLLKRDLGKLSEII